MGRRAMTLRAWLRDPTTGPACRFLGRVGGRAVVLKRCGSDVFLIVHPGEVCSASAAGVRLAYARELDDDVEVVAG